MSKYYLSSNGERDIYVGSSDKRTDVMVGVTSKGPVSFDANMGLKDTKRFDAISNRYDNGPVVGTASFSTKANLTPSTSALVGVGGVLGHSRTTTFTTGVSQKITDATSLNVNHTRTHDFRGHSTSVGLNRSFDNGNLGVSVSSSNFGGTSFGIGMGFKF